jgi:hypothetical protein
MERETGLEPATSSLGIQTYVKSKSLARFCRDFLNLQHLAESGFSELVTPNEARMRQVFQQRMDARQVLVTPRVCDVEVSDGAMDQGVSPECGRVNPCIFGELQKDLIWESLLWRSRSCVRAFQTKFKKSGLGGAFRTKPAIRHWIAKACHVGFLRMRGLR